MRLTIVANTDCVRMLQVSSDVEFFRVYIFMARFYDNAHAERTEKLRTELNLTVCGADYGEKNKIESQNSFLLSTGHLRSHSAADDIC